VVELERVSGERLGDLIGRGMARVVVPFGSIEHHGGHLPLGADALLADAVGREVADRLDAVLAPTVRVGCAERHLASMGTMSVRADTLTRTAIEVAVSLSRHGFRVIVLVSTHGGNTMALRAAVAQLETALVEAVVVAPEGDVGPRPGSHSGAWLTSVMLGLHADLVELARATGDLAAELREADARRGADNLERFVASIVGQVRSLELRR
jgi:creatinine amidohydrolase